MKSIIFASCAIKNSEVGYTVWNDSDSQHDVPTFIQRVTCYQLLNLETKPSSPCHFCSARHATFHSGPRRPEGAWDAQDFYFC